MTDRPRNLTTSLLVLVALFALGTAGFVAIGQRPVFESLYVTVVVLSTVGMKETGAALTQAEQAWAMLLMVAGIGTVLYATGNVVAFMIDGQMRALLGRRQVMHKVNGLSGHFIVVGFGRMGRALCLTLSSRGVPFVLIENEDDRLRMADEMGFLYLRGDAIKEASLNEAGIDRAEGLACCLPRDADNVFVTLTARGLNPSLKIITRAEDVETETKLKRAGADRVICPPLIGAGMVTQHLLNPLVEEILELDGHWPDLEISKLAVHRVPHAAGRTIAEVTGDCGAEVMVVAQVGADGHRHFNPAPDSRLSDGDELVIIGPAGSVKQAMQTLGRQAA